MRALMDRTNRRRTISICVLLGAVTLASFWPVLHNSFINFDDPEYVTENPHVISGLTWENVAWAFRTGYAGNWHPLTWLSHMLDAQIFGLKPAGHHLTNLLFHIINTILLFLVLRRMTGTEWRSAFVAALFGLHPLHVESVAWISEPKDVLSAFFFMLTVWAYTRYAQSKVLGLKSKVALASSIQHPASSIQHPASTIHHPSSAATAPFFYLLALLFFALGLMSKPMLVTLPFVLLLLDFWPLRRLELSTLNSHSTNRKLKTQNSKLKTVFPLLLEKIPFFALAAAASAVTMLVQSKQGAVAPAGLPFE